MIRRGHAKKLLNGNTLVDHCPDDGTTITVAPLSEGDPILPGQRVATFQELPDGHVEYEEYVLNSSGPAQVATDAYRRGYEETFGKKEVN